MIALGCRAANTLLAATGEKTRKKEQYGKQKKDAQAVTGNREKRRADIIKGNVHVEDRRKDAHAVTEETEREREPASILNRKQPM